MVLDDLDVDEYVAVDISEVDMTNLEGIEAMEQGDTRRFALDKA